MARLEGFDREIVLATKGLEPEAISKMLASFARSEVAKAISSGAASPRYEKYVNGRAGAEEETVVAPGPILYQFTNWPLVINAAIEELQKRTRTRTGRYHSSFIIIVNGKTIASDYSKIRADAEVAIINAAPYTRKLDNSRGSNRRHFLRAYWALRTRFLDFFAITHVYLNVRAGLYSSIPYSLKRDGGRKDRRKGMPITYPAIVINAL